MQFLKTILFECACIITSADYWKNRGFFWGVYHSRDRLHTDIKTLKSLENARTPMSGNLNQWLVSFYHLQWWSEYQLREYQTFRVLDTFSARELDLQMRQFFFSIKKRVQLIDVCLLFWNGSNRHHFSMVDHLNTGLVYNSDDHCKWMMCHTASLLHCSH